MSEIHRRLAGAVEEQVRRRRRFPQRCSRRRSAPAKSREVSGVQQAAGDNRAARIRYFRRPGVVQAVPRQCGATSETFLSKSRLPDPAERSASRRCGEARFVGYFRTQITANDPTLRIRRSIAAFTPLALRKSCTASAVTARPAPRASHWAVPHQHRLHSAMAGEPAVAVECGPRRKSQGGAGDSATIAAAAVWATEALSCSRPCRRPGSRIGNAGETSDVL